MSQGASGAGDAAAAAAADAGSDDHYAVLGLAVEATVEEVRRAYRRLSLRWHPDKNRGDAAAAARFAALSRAHRVLVDPEQRAEFDAHIRARVLRQQRDAKLDAAAAAQKQALAVREAAARAAAQRQRSGADAATVLAARVARIREDGLERRRAEEAVRVAAAARMRSGPAAGQQQQQQQQQDDIGVAAAQFDSYYGPFDVDDFDAVEQRILSELEC